MKGKKIAFVTKNCVACGVCEKVCPINAIYVFKGMFALVKETCVGCGKCAGSCPAQIINMRERREVIEKEMV